MNLAKVDKVFLLGIGGIGMSALARYFNSIGKKVCGYDKTPSPLTDKLLEEGCEVFFEQNAERIPNDYLNDSTLFIYTPAIIEEGGQLHGLRWAFNLIVFDEVHAANAAVEMMGMFM